MLTTNEVCEMLHITSRTLYRYVHRGWIIKYKINSQQNIYKYEDVRALAQILSEKRHNPNSTACKMAMTVQVHKHR